VGTSFGAGNGSTTFNIPDMRLKFARGAGTGASVGSAGGSDSHGHGNVDATISINHSHNVSVNTSGNTDSVPNHQHITTQSGISGNTSAVVANVASNTFNVSRASGNLATAGSGHGHTASSHSHGPGNIVVTRNDPQSGGHSHNVSTSGSGNTSNTGGNRSISAPTASVPSIPSYTTVNYIIKT
jgi:microcystin-dependent protein